MSTAQQIANLTIQNKSVRIAQCERLNGRRMNYRTEPKVQFWFDDGSNVHIWNDGTVLVEKLGLVA